VIRPGLILREAWTVYRAHWLRLVPLALVVYVPLAVVTVLVEYLIENERLAYFMSLFIALAGAFWVQGALVEAIASVREGRGELSLSHTLERIAPRVNELAAAGLLAGAGVALGTLALIVPGLILLTWWSVLVPVLILERTPVLAAFARSRELVRGRGWQVFGVIVLTLLILLALTAIGTILVFAWIDETAAIYIRDVVAASFFAPFAALAWTLTYYRLRELQPA